MPALLERYVSVVIRSRSGFQSVWGSRELSIKASTGPGREQPVKWTTVNRDNQPVKFERRRCTKLHGQYGRLTWL